MLFANVTCASSGTETSAPFTPTRLPFIVSEAPGAIVKARVCEPAISSSSSVTPAPAMLMAVSPGAGAGTADVRRIPET